MTSIDDLAKRLEQIDSTFDEATKLKRWSFEKTLNNTFGVPESSDFSVFLSFDPKWPSKDQVPGLPSNEVKTEFPSPLQNAFKQVLQHGKDSGNKVCFIDLASLNPETEFFTQGEDKSVAKALLEAVDCIDPQIQPVIRIVCGDWEDHNPGKWDDGSRWRTMFEEIFWDQNGNSRLEKNKNALLCVGYYRPVLSINKDGQ